RAISREGKVEGNRASFQFSQIYQDTEHYVLMEVEMDSAAAAAERDFGQVRVAYTLPNTGAKQVLNTAIRGRFSARPAEAKAGCDQRIEESVVEQNTRQGAQAAVELLRYGNRSEAMRLFNENSAEIKEYLANGGTSSATIKELQSTYEGYAAAVPAAPASAVNDYSKALRAYDLKGAGSKSRY